MKKDNEEKIDIAIDVVGNVVGQTAGTILGTAVAGIPGAAFGGAAGALVQSIFNRLGEDIKNRILSKKEEERIGNVMRMAFEKIQKNKYAGKKLRGSEFFDANEQGRSSAEEILEGILLLSQREYEERKLPYIANLYANICFDDQTSNETVCELIKLAQDITYRKMAIINCVSLLQRCPIIPTKKYNGKIQGLNNVAIATDTCSLYRQGLLMSKAVIFDPAGVNPRDLTVGGLGALMFKYMELDTLPIDAVLKDTFSFFSEYSLVEQKPPYHDNEKRND